MGQEMTFADVNDHYQSVVYNREKLVESIHRVIREKGAERILDCACGTGLPALDLRARGLDVMCTDGDGDMLRRFRGNAAGRGVSGHCRHLRWEELPAQLSETFDYVMCRGNSFVYATTWERARSTAATDEVLRRNLVAIAGRVGPGGYLHIDVPAEQKLDQKRYYSSGDDEFPVSVEEEVLALTDRRIWIQQVDIGPVRYRFTRQSALCTPRTIAGMLRELGFDPQPIELAGERPSYQVILARRCGS